MLCLYTEDFTEDGMIQVKVVVDIENIMHVGDVEVDCDFRN